MTKSDRRQVAKAIKLLSSNSGWDDGMKLLFDLIDVEYPLGRDISELMKDEPDLETIEDMIIEN